MLALGREEAEPKNAYGIPMRDATDPNAVWDAPERPTLDYSVVALARRQKAYYAMYDTDKKNPMDRSGQLWRVRKRNT